MAQQNDISAQWGKLSPQERSAVLSQMTPQEESNLAESLGWNARHDYVSAAPAKWSPAWMKEHAYAWRNWAINQLPQVGGMIGGIIGAGAGAESGPGAVATAMLGAGAGGALGEDARQAINRYLYPNDRPMGPIESAVRMIAQGGLQSANELGGQVPGRIVGHAANAIGSRVLTGDVLERYPVLKKFFALGEPKAKQHLTAAAAQKGTYAASASLKALGNTIGDIESEMSQLPRNEQTVDGFLKAVNSRKDAMNVESGAAMLPIAGEKIVPTGVADEIRNLSARYDRDVPGDKPIIAHIRKAAAEWEHPISYRALDQKRSNLASDLSKFNAQESVARYNARMGDVDLAIDNAIEKGLREAVYPAMDRAAGKPAGYFENLKQRQSSLITLQSILNKRIEWLKGSQAISEAQPLFSGENISIYARPESLPRTYIHGIQRAIAPQREYAEASKHVARAFKPSVSSLPYQLLFSNLIRGAEISKGPKTQKLRKLRDRSRFSHVDVGANGHRIEK